MVSKLFKEVYGQHLKDLLSIAPYSWWETPEMKLLREKQERIKKKLNRTKVKSYI